MMNSFNGMSAFEAMAQAHVEGVQGQQELVRLIADAIGEKLRLVRHHLRAKQLA